MDHTGKPIKEFQSLIKTQKKTEELKQIVGFITGLSIQDLETAPSREEVLPQIQEFFGANTIIIGHNIGFDINFLEKFFPGAKYLASIDTYRLSQALVHYAPSYALEVLIQHLSTKEVNFLPLLTSFTGQAHSNDKSHDALYDTKESLALFTFLAETIQQTQENYPAFARIRQQSEGIFAKIFSAQEVVQTSIQFPSLSKVAPAHISLEKNDQEIKRENQKRYYIGNCSIKAILKHLASNKECILVFQNIQKLDIAKKILNDMGIKNIGFIKEEQTINESMFKDFLNKAHFNEDEFLFIAKYLSQLQKGYGMLDLNTQADYKIYHAIKDTREKVKYPIVLATHAGIYTMIEEEQNTYTQYEIFFFDTERWYKTYNFFLSRPYDMHYTLSAIENILYKQQLKKQIQETKGQDITDKEKTEKLNNFYQLFQIFVGVLSSETSKIFTSNDAYMTINPIIENPSFHQTNLLRQQCKEQQETLETYLDEEEKKFLIKQLTHLEKIINGIVNINKKMYNQSDFYFVYAEAQRYTDRKEFVDIFPTNIYFLSNANKEYPHITISNESNYTPTKIPTRNLERIDAIIQEITKPEQKEKNIFIFSPRKEESKKIFEQICEKDIHKEASILVENITGGVGKNIFKATGAGKKIIIGGNSFLLYLYANGITIDEIILFNSK